MKKSLLQYTKTHAFLIIGVLLCFILYLPSLNYDLLYSLDDGWLLVYNSAIQELSFESITHLFIGDHTDLHYHPLTYLSLAIDYHFFGPSAFHFRLHNLLLHLANIVLIYVFLLQLFKQKNTALFVALLFAFASLHIESIVWASSRRQVLSLFFALSALIVYLRYLQSKVNKNLYVILAIACWCLSMLAKANFIVLPGVFLFIAWYLKGSKFIRKPVILQFFLMGLICLAVLYVNQLADGRNFLKRSFDYTAWEHIVFVGYSIGFYVWKFILPFPQGVFYPAPTEGLGLPLGYYLSALLAVLLLVLAGYHWRKKQYALCLVLAIYFLNTLLMANRILFPFSDIPSLVIDKYFYHNGLWIICYLVLLIQSLRIKQSIQYALIIVLLVVQVVSFRIYLPHWKNSIALFEYTLAHYPSEEFYYRLGIDYYKAGQKDQAVEAFAKADELHKNIWINNDWYFYFEKSLVYLYEGDCDAVTSSYDIMKTKSPKPTFVALYAKYINDSTTCTVEPMALDDLSKEEIEHYSAEMLKLIHPH